MPPALIPSRKNKMNKKKAAGTLAAVAAGALLLGGTTSALWSDSETLAGGNITAGNLDVASLGTSTWQDVSADPAVDIDLDTFRIVPGDTLQGTQAVDVALEGDNMVANFDVSLPAASGDLLSDTNGVTLNYVVTDDAGAEVGGAAVGTPSQVTLVPEDVSAELDGTADYTVTLTAAFDESTPDQVRTQATAALAEAGVTLTQVRPGQ